MLQLDGYRWHLFRLAAFSGPAAQLTVQRAVALWRRLRTIGAAGILNGVWALPRTASHARFFKQLQDTVRSQGGRVFVMAVPESSPDTDAMIVERFRADRGREYDGSSNAAMPSSPNSARRRGRHTFAELEENEQELEKLTRWLAKIQARDFFPDERQPQAQKLAERCQKAWRAFLGRSVGRSKSSRRRARIRGRWRLGRGHRRRAGLRWASQPATVIGAPTPSALNTITVHISSSRAAAVTLQARRAYRKSVAHRRCPRRQKSAGRELERRSRRAGKTNP